MENAVVKLGEIRRATEIGHKAYHKYIWHACIDCGKEKWVLLKNGNPQSLRCNPCASKIRGSQRCGEKNPGWKGGRYKTSRGYITILLQPDDFFYPMINSSGYVAEHRLVVAKALGRCLHSWEIVHHKGAKYPKGSIEDKQDNRYPENLQLVSDDRHNQITILENEIARLKKRLSKYE